MNRKTLSSVAALILALPLSLLAACGSPSALELCYMGCDYNKKCLSSSDVDRTNCLNNCNDKKGTFSDADNQLAKDCKNAGEIRSKQAACYSKACGEVPGCLLSSDTNACVRP